MVEKLKEEFAERWPMLTLVLLLAGGGTSMGNFLTGSRGEMITLTEEVRELSHAVRSNWTVSMEVTAWERAGREIRKHQPEWIGPDCIEIKKLHNNGGML